MRLCLFALLLTTACSRRDPDDRWFAQLSIVFAKDYPLHEPCEPGPACTLVQRANEARGKIFANGTAAALARTLAVVERDCVTSRWAGRGQIDDEERACRGAAVAISELSDPDSDARIRGVLAADCGLYRAIVQTASVEAMGNRPAPAAWTAIARACQRR